MIKVNGKEYPLWSQFVENKEKWIGGTLDDSGDFIDRAIGLTSENSLQTEITDIELIPNGEDSAFFQVVGKDFTCGFDVGSGGMSGGSGGEDGYWVTFSGYGGHEWRIKAHE